MIENYRTNNRKQDLFLEFGNFINMYVLIGLRLHCVRYVTLETALHVSLCLMCFACAHPFAHH